MTDKCNSQSDKAMSQSFSYDKKCEPDFAALIGIDWGDKQHAYCIRSSDGHTHSATLIHSSESIHQWLLELEQRFESKPVAIAIEAGCVPLMAALRQYPWAMVYRIHPLTSHRFRSAFTPSGAKDDLPDAQVLLKLLLNHREQLRPMPELAAQQTRQLDGLVQDRRDLVDQRTTWILELQAALKAYFPQALELLPDELDRPVVQKFLTRWPELLELKRARPSTLKKFFYQFGYRRPELIDQKIQQIKDANAIESDPINIQRYRRKVKHLIESITLANRQIKELQAQINTTFKAHQNWQFFKNLPGAGPAMAPRLLCAIEQAPQDDAQGIQNYSGVAPVKEKSGDRCWVHRRWNAPKFLHQTWIEWAGLTVQFSRWAKVFYDQAKQRGKGRYTILRALAFKWIRILARCQQTGENYDEQRYIARLIQRGSPLAKGLQ